MRPQSIYSGIDSKPATERRRIPAKKKAQSKSRPHWGAFGSRRQHEGPSHLQGTSEGVGYLTEHLNVVENSILEQLGHGPSDYSEGAGNSMTKTT